MKPDDLAIQKDFEDKKQMALTFLNLLIFSINEQALLQYQLIHQFKIGTPKEKVFESNINHAFALLEAAKVGITKNGPSAYTDYLITSALSKIAEYLPADSVKKITHRLDDFTKDVKKSSSLPHTETTSSTHHSNSHSSILSKLNPTPDNSRSSTKKTEQNNTDKKFNDLISCVSPTLLTQDSSSQIHDDKRIVIDFCADDHVFKKAGIAIARKQGAHLIQAQPDRFSADKEKFSITKDTTITLIGHCSKGLNCLVNNSGQIITASEIAKQLFLKMSKTGTPLDTEFSIDLIACQAASRDGKHPSFAEHLIHELSSYGINNAKVIASPTIMLACSNGDVGNMSVEEDEKFEHRHRHKNLVNYLMGSFSSMFEKSDTSELGLKVAKVTFRSDQTSHARRF